MLIIRYRCLSISVNCRLKLITVQSHLFPTCARTTESGDVKSPPAHRPRPLMSVESGVLVTSITCFWLKRRLSNIRSSITGIWKKQCRRWVIPIRESDYSWCYEKFRIGLWLYIRIITYSHQCHTDSRRDRWDLARIEPTTMKEYS